MRKMTRLRPFAVSLLLLCLATRPEIVAASAIASPGADNLVRAALTAEAAHDTQRALDLFLAAEKAGRGDAFLLQKIARQYSDLTLDLGTRAEQHRTAERALEYSRRAVALEPQNAVNVLSVAISHGRLALASDIRDKVRHSRLVREEAERALALDPRYAWAHHVLGRWHYEVADLGATSRAIVKLFYGGLPSASARQAVEHLEHAVALEPDELQHHLELGFAYRAVGDTDRARAAFERGLAMPNRAKHDASAKARARAALIALAPASRR